MQHRKSCDGRPAFSADTLDTFCFRWPAFRCYVLVRVLDNSIALLPIQSRRAFLYFQHAPLPQTPTPPCTPTWPSSAFKFRDSRIHHMFHSWKHTLALSDLRQEDNDSSDNEAEDNATRVMSPSCAVTLADVMHDQPHLNDGWVHARCQARADPETGTALIIESTHNLLLLKARSRSERRMFLNLVKLRQIGYPGARPRPPPHMPSSSLTARQIVLQYRAQSRHIYDQIRRLSHRLQQDEADVSTYAERLARLDDSWNTLANAVRAAVGSHDGASSSLQHHHRSLDQTAHRLRRTMRGYAHLAQRMHDLDKHIEANPDAVGAARIRLMLDNGRSARRWLMCLRLVVILGCIGCIGWLVLNGLRGGAMSLLRKVKMK